MREIYGIIIKTNADKPKERTIVMENYSKKKSFLALVGALLLVIASTALLVCKYFEEKAHYEKWKDYDECGI